MGTHLPRGAGDHPEKALLLNEVSYSASQA